MEKGQPATRPTARQRALSARLPEHAHLLNRHGVHTPLLCSLLHRSLRGGDKQPPPNIAKADTTAEKHAPKPGRSAQLLITGASRKQRSGIFAGTSATAAHAHALLLAPPQRGRRRRRSRHVANDGRGGNDNGSRFAEEQQDERAGEADGRGQREAGFGAVEEVPQGGVDEGEGQGDLEG